MLGWAALFRDTGPARKWGLLEISLGATAFLVRARDLRQWPFARVAAVSSAPSEVV